MKIFKMKRTARIHIYQTKGTSFPSKIEIQKKQEKDLEKNQPIATFPSSVRNANISDTQTSPTRPSTTTVPSNNLYDSKKTFDIMNQGNSHYSYYQTVIKPNLSRLYEIKEKDTDIQFRKYNFRNISSSFLLTINVILTLILLPMTILSSHFDANYTKNDLAIMSIVSVSGLLAACSAVVSGWILYWLHATDFYSKNSAQRLLESVHSQLLRFPMLSSSSLYTQFYHRCCDYQSSIQQSWLLSVYVLSILIFLRSQLVNGCSKITESSSVVNQLVLPIWNCDQDRDIAGIPNSASLLIILLPFLSLLAMREPRWWLCVVFHTISVSVFIAVLYQRIQFNVAFTMFLWWIIGLILLFDFHKQYLINFFITNQLKATLSENLKYADQVQANEMKHMIANVAHDLKTPLVSLTSGIDLIAHIVSECEQQMTVQASDDESGQLLHRSLCSIQSCLQNLRSTNAFMIMAINRCIDYTKASNGLKLVPRYETIMLKETLELPLNCMKNIQDQCTIELLPIPSEICNTVITDKQWLQENVLCLLSNAVKYSTAGAITVSVSLVKGESSISAEMTAEMIHSPFRSSNHRFRKSGTSFHELDQSPQFSLLSNSSSALTPTRADHNTPSVIGNKHLKVAIRDTGIGLTDQTMKSLFQPFKQTQRLVGGTGLGLYSLAKRTEALHGNYGVEKRHDVEHGSIFWFSIPYRPDETDPQSAEEFIQAKEQSEILDQQLHELKNSDDDADSMNNLPVIPLEHNLSMSKVTGSGPQLSTIEAHRDPLAGASQRIEVAKPNEEKNLRFGDLSINNLSILIVDDSSSIIKMLTMLLKKQGHSTQTAQNGEIALKAIEDRWKQCQQPFEVILMDLQMPVMDGLEATRRLRRMESEGRDWMRLSGSEESYRHHHVIIGMSANSDHDTTAEAYESGVDAFMGKPFSIELFNKTVTDLLDQRYYF